LLGKKLFFKAAFRKLPSNSNVVADQTATLFGVDQDYRYAAGGRHPNKVNSHSVLCCWPIRKLSKRPGILSPTADQSAKRGEKIAQEKRLKMIK
jgi:hypothetical protein